MTSMDRKRPHGGSVLGRRYIKRDRHERHEMILNDYFKGEDSKYTAEQFRRRFRMDVELFNRILHAIGNYDHYFTPKVDAVGRCGISPLQKMVAALRMLAYGCAADLLDDIVNGVAPPCPFVVNGHQYEMGYYLSDGIYPSYATLIQSISEPSLEKEKLFAKCQEAVRKDVERAFGVLQSRWHIVKGPARMWNAKDLGKIMKTCIILHNMIIESETRKGINPEDWIPHVDEKIDNVSVERDYNIIVSKMISRLKEVRSTSTHKDLKVDLIDHLWNREGVARD